MLEAQATITGNSETLLEAREQYIQAYHMGPQGQVDEARRQRDSAESAVYQYGTHSALWISAGAIAGASLKIASESAYLLYQSQQALRLHRLQTQTQAVIQQHLTRCRIIEAEYQAAAQNLRDQLVTKLAEIRQAEAAGNTQLLFWLRIQQAETQQQAFRCMEAAASWAARYRILSGL
jgi:hypothetical protein